MFTGEALDDGMDFGMEDIEGDYENEGREEKGPPFLSSAKTTDEW